MIPRFSFLGRQPFLATARLQQLLRDRVVDGDLRSEIILGLEHDPVITFGRRACAEHLLVSSAELARRGITVAEADRGGDVTYHGPGQLVVYPVMRLRRGIVAHVRALADAAISVAARFGVQAEFRRDCPGVWVGDRKLASIGVHVHHGVATHGIALNLTTALDNFTLIRACGLDARPTSLSQLCGDRVSVDEAWQLFRAPLGYLCISARTLSAPSLV